MNPHATPSCDEEDEHAEGCMCGTEHQVQEHEATPDDQLPPATGGVAGDKVPRLKRPNRGLAKAGEL